MPRRERNHEATYLAALQRFEAIADVVEVPGRDERVIHQAAEVHETDLGQLSTGSVPNLL
jgi:hypothetical protein